MAVAEVQSGAVTTTLTLSELQRMAGEYVKECEQCGGKQITRGEPYLILRQHQYSAVVAGLAVPYTCRKCGKTDTHGIAI